MAPARIVSPYCGMVRSMMPNRAVSRRILDDGEPKNKVIELSEFTLEATAPTVTGRDLSVRRYTTERGIRTPKTSQKHYQYSTCIKSWKEPNLPGIGETHVRTRLAIGYGSADVIVSRLLDEQCKSTTHNCRIQSRYPTRARLNKRGYTIRTKPV